MSDVTVSDTGIASEALVVTDLREEFIDDRALRRAEQDLLGHDDVAQELACLFQAVETPASVALFAPWGAGKSSLANLLDQKLASDACRFVRFDAFKYAQNPLRRHFLSQVARKLGVNDEKFTEGLYRSENTTRIPLKLGPLLQLVAFFAAAFLVLEVLAVVITLIVAALSKGPFADAFSANIGGALALGTFPGLVIGALFALANRSLPVERQHSEPSSEEEFGRLFEELIESVEADRIVVFIDELDRCSPPEVVSTLETIRTFLDVEKCIVVVAADQQALERALQDRARQATPVNTANPYFSAGSAYLDKIFQYQLELPPLMARRAEYLALRLVEKRAGIWKEIDVDRVLFALLPTHVKSPRRVKVLLNSFVITYRVAKRRAADGKLSTPIAERAAEIAKLVCLRTEFPLFAADLASDARLPEYVLRANRGDKLPEHLPDASVQLAEGYANGRLSPDLLLPAAGHEQRAPSKAAEDPEAEATGVAQEDRGDGEDARARKQVGRALSQQLIAYLEKTSQQVPGPGRDLIHMEGGGATFDLEPELADQIEDAAIDGRADTVRDIVQSLEPDGRRGALRLIARRTREAPLNLQGANLVSVLLASLFELGDELDPIADELADAVATQQQRLQLRSDDLYGAYRLSLRSNRPNRVRLQQAVLEHPDCAANEDLGTLLLADAADALKFSPERVGQIAARRIIASPQEAAKAMGRLDRDTLRAVLDRAGAEFDAGSSSTTGDDGEEIPPRWDLVETLAALEAVLEAFLEGDRKAQAEEIAVTLLGRNTTEARSTVLHHLASLSPVASPMLARALVVATSQRRASEWPRWLAALKPGQRFENRLEAFAELVLTLWRRSVAEAEGHTEETFTAGLAAVSGAVAKTQRTKLDITDEVVATFSERTIDESAPETFVRLIAQADQLAEAGFVSTGRLASVAAERLQEALERGLPPRPGEDAFAQAISELTLRVVPTLGKAARASLRENLIASPWMPSPLREGTAIRVAHSQAELDGVREQVYGAAAVAELLTTYESEFGSAAGLWLESLCSSPNDALLVADALPSWKLPEAIVDGVGAFAGRSDQHSVDTLVAHWAASPSPPTRLLAAIGPSNTDQQKAAALLVKRFSNATNSRDRETVLRIWRALGFDDAGARKSLVADIAIPMAEQGKGALDLVVSNLGLCLPPPYGTKGRLIDVLRGEAGGRKQKRRVDRALLEAGLIERSGFLKTGRKTT